MLQNEIEYLEEIINARGEAGHLISEWERKFIDDQQSRYEKYAADTKMSPKQWAVLDKIANKLGVGR